jgi:hypothetical protein
MRPSNEQPATGSSGLNAREMSDVTRNSAPSAMVITIPGARGQLLRLAADGANNFSVVDTQGGSALLTGPPGPLRTARATELR